MFSLFGNEKEAGDEVLEAAPTLSHGPVATLDFDAFSPGIDNVHIDVCLSPKFLELTTKLTQDMLVEFGTGNKRVNDKPSPALNNKLKTFTDIYANMLETAIHRAKKGKRLDQVQLFQVAIAQFLFSTIRKESEHLINKLRAQALQGNHGVHKNRDLHERISRMSRQQHSLFSHICQLLFSRLQWVENNSVAQLRRSLLGEIPPLPEAMLFNPLLLNQEKSGEELQLQYYVLLHQQSSHVYSFSEVDGYLEKVLDKIARSCCGAYLDKPILLTDPSSNQVLGLSWHDEPECLKFLFDVETAERELSWAVDKLQKKQLDKRLKERLKAIKELARYLQKNDLLLHISAAYHTVQAYPYFAYALKPYTLYRALCGEMAIDTAYQKIEVQQKIRNRRAGEEFEPASTLGKIKKTAKRASQNDAYSLSFRFVQDFMRYRRDMKFLSLMNGAMEKINLLHDEKEILLSKTNGMLNAFLQQDEYSGDDDTIHSHTILKADIRGSTTVVDELNKRHLNPATHFSRNFFEPISRQMKAYGAEKVFIEGDAIILSLFEYQAKPKEWLSVARACGMALSILEVVESQNHFCRQNNLPLLEIGIGICYAGNMPDFLYDGEQRIMISGAIGKADRLSSCSWALREKFAAQNLLNRVMVFQQPEGEFKGEKGIETLRYNLNGIELDALAFTKLREEITLKPVSLDSSGDEHTKQFYFGRYPDVKGEFHEILVREAYVRMWQSDTSHYPLTETLYYEVMSTKRVRKRG